MKYEDLKYLAIPLPEAVAKEKWGGFFDNARERIEAYLEDEKTDYGLRCRLELELGILDNLESRYTVTPEEALEIMHERIPDLTAEELERLRMEDKADWIYVNGEIRYIDCFAATLYKVYHEVWNRTKEGDTSDYSLIEDFIHSRTDGCPSTAHIHISHELAIAENACREGERIRVHMPIPLERNGITNLKINNCTHKPVSVSQNNEAQPTIFFEEIATKGQKFVLEYEFDYTVPYHDLCSYLDGTSKPVDESPCAENRVGEFSQEDLQEKAPHIVFTPLLRNICEEIVGSEMDPLHKARKIYDYVTTETDYRFVRDYASIDNIPEYCALNRRGDCGVQALLFITLCRIAGIPARWESGLEASPNYVGEHDWARFFISEFGWLYADLAGGALAYVRGAYDRWNFFFGNADPYRIPINDDFQEDFVPQKHQWRLDPYDNQCGEIEYDDCGIYGENLVYSHKPIEIYLK